jgi:predicted enzyme related to lactoylglutathione lyase
MEPKAGDIVHFEINTTNPQRAKKFYSSVFGWKYKDSSMPGIEYYLIDGVTPGGGINPLTEPSKVKAPTVYFGTDDIDSTLKKIKDSGGTTEQKAPIPGQGWFAACVDPDGNAFSLFQSDPTITMEQMTEYQAAGARA